MGASACTYCGLVDTLKERRLPGAGGGRSELLRQMPRSVGGFISSSRPEDGARAHADTALTANGSAAGSAVGPRGGFNALKFKLPGQARPGGTPEYPAAIMMARFSPQQP